MTTTLRRGSTLLALALSGSLIGGSLAYADNINDSIEGNQTVTLTDANPSGSFGIKVVSTNNDDPQCNIDSGESLSVVLNVPAGFTVSGTDYNTDTKTLTFSAGQCDNFKTLSVARNADAVDSASNVITVASWSGTAANADDERYNANVSVPLVLDNDGDGTRNSTDTTPNGETSGGGDTGGGGGAVDLDADDDGINDDVDNCDNVASQDQTDADNDGFGKPCDTNDAAPMAVANSLVTNSQRNEGQTLTASGAFSDADGNSTLTITPSSTVVVFTANPDGTWSWSLDATDDVAAASITVTASDGDLSHANARQSFTYSAANVAPVITGVAQTRQGPCAVTLDPSFTDAGSADTHTESILWADGSTSFARTFTAAGSYSATVTVTDDDHSATVNGQDTEAVAGVRAYNVPSAIMEPINTSGTRSGFKQGSTVPVKITVAGCSGPVSDIVPVVNLVEGDTVADVPINEASVTEVATNGKEMRWSTDKYIYNLSTKLSQHLNKALQGTYTVSVNHPTFERSTNATFDVRK